MFTDAKIGREIFSQWRKELGIDDEEERLWVAIVRGVDTREPHSYRVIFGSNPKGRFSPRDRRYVAVMHRVHTMHAESDENLEAFLRSYKKSGRYFLAPAFNKQEKFEPEIIYGYHLVKHDLSVKEAWEIGANDSEAVALKEDDVPIIPAGQENAPVVALLQRLRQCSSAQPSTVGRARKR